MLKKYEVSHLVDLFEDKLAEVQETGAQLADILRKGALFAYIARDDTMDDVVAALTDVEFNDDTIDPRSALPQPGLIGLPSQCLRLVEKAHYARQDLVSFLRYVDKQGRVDGYAGGNYVARTAGYTRLHRKAIERNIHTLAHPPQSAHFFWDSVKTTHKIRAGDAMLSVDRLLKETGLDADTQRKLMQERHALGALDQDELLARVYRPAPQPKVVFDHTMKSNTLSAHLPVFFPCDCAVDIKLTPLPASAQGTGRKKRSDTKLRDQPITNGSRLYRYRTPAISGDGRTP